MSVGEVIAALFMASAFLATGRHYHDRFWLGAALAVVISEAIAIGRFGFRLVVFREAVSGSLVLASALIGLLLWAQVLGLPRRLALLLGIGLTSRPLRFHNRLIDVRKGLDEAIVRAQSDQDWRAEAIAVLESHIRAERALRPPDADWASLRDDLASGDAAWVDLIQAGAPADDIADHAADYGRVRVRWAEMGERAAADQRLLATPARRRRGTAVWTATIGVSLLILGLGQVSSFDLRSIGLTDGRVLVVATSFLGAALAFVTSLVLTVRRD